MRASLDRIVYTTQTSPAKAAELKKQAASKLNEQATAKQGAPEADAFEFAKKKKKPRPHEGGHGQEINGTYDPVGDVKPPTAEELKLLRDEALVEAIRAVCAKHKVYGYSEVRGIIFSVIDNIDGYVKCVYTGDQKPASTQPSGFNIEHQWPQSKGAKGPAKSDMHHLAPTDIDINSLRGSYPFGVVVTELEGGRGGSKIGLDAKGNKVFEPRDDHKGNVARALFYFAVVYGYHIPDDEESALRAWDKADPVDANETERNNRIEKYQGNRNQFVDDPSLINRITNIEQG